MVVDLPEAVFTRQGLIFLAHTHIPTIWGEREREIQFQDWQQSPAGGLQNQWTLPDQVQISSSILVDGTQVLMELSLHNQSDTPLTQIRSQVCIMLKGAPAFDRLSHDNKIFDDPVAAVRHEEKNYWILTAWKQTDRVWGNTEVPCLHVDPILPDCAPGETVRNRGLIWCVEGSDIHQKIRELKLAVQSL